MKLMITLVIKLLQNVPYQRRSNKVLDVFRTSHVPLPEKCPNTEFYLVRIFLYSEWIRRLANIRIQSEYKKIRTRKISVYGHLSRNVRSIYVLCPRVKFLAYFLNQFCTKRKNKHIYEKYLFLKNLQRQCVSSVELLADGWWNTFFLVKLLHIFVGLQYQVYVFLQRFHEYFDKS